VHNELSTTYLFESLERQDARLKAAREYLALLEADPTADKLTIVATRRVVTCRRAAVAEEIACER
jgi:hypothetical protein